MNKKNLQLNIIFFIIFTLIFSFAFYIISLEKTNRIQSILQQELISTKTLYNFILAEYEKRADSSYKRIQNDAKVIELFSKGVKARGKEQDKLRAELNDLLQAQYLELKEVGLANFNFMTPNTDVFLRLHKPSFHSDSLLGVRYTYEYTNRTHKPLRGFEQGRLKHAFRNSYPLFDEKGTYIGALGLGFSSQYFQDILTKSLDVHSNFLINKNLVEKTLHEDLGAEKYEQRPEYKDYLISTSEQHFTKRDEHLDVLESFQSTIESKMLSGEEFYLYLINTDSALVITFLAIIEPKNKKSVAYLVSFKDQPEILKVHKNYQLLILAIFVIMLIISIFIYRNLQKNAQLKYSHNLLRSIINTVPLRIFWKDRNLNYLGCNTLFATDAGKRDEYNIIGKSDYDLIWKKHADAYRNDDKNIIDSQIARLFYEESQTDPTGKKIWLRTSKAPLYDNNNIIGVLGMYEDITHAKCAQSKLKESQQQLKAIIENEPEWVTLLGPNMELIDINPAGLKMLQTSTLEEAQKHTIKNYIFPQWMGAFTSLHKEVMNGNSAILIFKIQGLKGEQRWIEMHAVPMRDFKNEVTMLLGISRDITQRKESEERINYMANFDALTGLPNRANLDNKINYILHLAKRNQWKFSLMFLDLDHFKDINDTLGHDVGDALLIELGKRIQSILREDDTVARLGGDEFILLLPDTDTDGAQLVAQKLLTTINLPYSIEQHQIRISASIGIAIYPEDGLDKETLFKNADTAMYQSKNGGRNHYSFFTQEMQTNSKRNMELNNALHHAIENDELYLHYQPQISLTSGNIIGVEALLRWQSPEFGNIAPTEFIHIAENSGLILAIGEWVLRTSTLQLKTWIQDGFKPILMAVNLSSLQFSHPDLQGLITKVLQSTGLPAEYLELELTEGIALTNPKEAVKIMNKLYEQGIKMSIDDFGTGYSNLNYLKKFKIYKLKIDKSFVQDITTDPEDRAIVSAIIHMANSLGLTTIAEGVETIEQLDFLREQGCNEVQGYYFSKPLSVEEFEELYIKQTDY